MEDYMNKNKKTLVVVFVVIGIVALGLAAGVYAKYSSTLSSASGTAEIAKWAFETDNATAALKCEPAKTYKEETLVEGKIAPGTSGTCKVSISNATSEVGVHYTIKIDSISGPANIVIKNGESTLTAGGTIEGNLDPKAATTEVSFDWEWPYYTSDANDATDTTAGKAAGAMEINYTISGYQVEPTE